MAEALTWLDGPTAAVVYAARGWAVLPCAWPTDTGCSCPRGPTCAHPGKHPWVRWRGIDSATRWPKDPASLRALFRDRPESNVAILTGAVSGLFVLDVDGTIGEDTLARLQVEHGPLPVTLMARTGSGGRHLFFAYPGPTPTTAGRLGPGLDTRSDGGLVIVPPSTHLTGGTYGWINWRVDLAAVPDWLLEALRSDRRPVRSQASPVRPERHQGATSPVSESVRLTSGNRYGRKVVKAELATVRSALIGERNHTLFRAAANIGALVVSCDLVEAEVRAALVNAGTAAGLEETEATDTVASGLTKGLANPRSVP